MLYSNIPDFLKNKNIFYFYFLKNQECYCTALYSNCTVKNVTVQHCTVTFSLLYSAVARMDPNESSRFPDFHVVASKMDQNESSRFPDFHYDSNYVNSARGKNCHYQTPRRLLWVGSQRGRCNMGAIEFLIPFFILNDFGAR